MPNHRLRRVLHFALEFLGVAAISLALATLTPAGAAEKVVPQSGKLKNAAKSGHQRAVKPAKLKKVSAHPHKSAQKSLATRKTAAKLKPASLKLARDIEPAAPTTTPRPAPVSRPIDPSIPKPSLDDKDPPLQIGKTLYQRNGEIRQLEGQ